MSRKVLAVFDIDGFLKMESLSDAQMLTAIQLARININQGKGIRSLPITLLTDIPTDSEKSVVIILSKEGVWVPGNTIPPKSFVENTQLDGVGKIMLKALELAQKELDNYKQL